MNDTHGLGPISGRINPDELSAAIEFVFASTPTGREMRMASVSVEDGTIAVVFKGSEEDGGGPFGARLPAPAVIGDEAWERYPDPVDLEEWATYAVLVLIVEEYDTGRLEGRGIVEDGIFWLQVQ
ncbi:hypothetical protein [Arthrobacter monumenti]